MAVILTAKIWPSITCKAKKSIPDNDYKLQSICNYPSFSRRGILVCSTSFLTILNLNCILTPSPLRAEGESNEQKEKDGIIGAIKSLFDPNEKTKSGKLLPTGYLKSAREVIKTLRESLNEDPKDNAKFRRTAEAAKESIKEYIGKWRGKKQVVHEESYVELEKAIKSLASFYSKVGPSATLPEEVKSEILKVLSTAEEFL